MVAEEHEDVRLVEGVEAICQLEQHLRGAFYAVAVNGEVFLRLGAEVKGGLNCRYLKAVFVIGIGLMVLDGGGVGEKAFAAGCALGKLVAEHVEEGRVEQAGLLVEGLAENAAFNAHVAQSAVAVIKPAVARVQVKGVVAAVGKRGGGAGDILEKAAHGGVAGSVYEVCLHSGQNVELCVRGAGAEIGNNDPARHGVGT